MIEPVRLGEDVTLYRGDCLEVLPTLEAGSVDAVVTDPPYGLSFMGKDWDHGVPGVRFWAEILRACKPGAMLLAFGGTRTHHRLMVAIEDAGWEIRDCLMWLYGSGFPKSHDISKAIDKAATVACPDCSGTGKQPAFDVPWKEWIERTRDYGGTKAEWQELCKETSCYFCDGTGKVKGAEREVVGKMSDIHPRYKTLRKATEGYRSIIASTVDPDRTAPATPEAAAWEGFGTGLKPAWEPIILAMKPIEGTYANNALAWNVAGINVDACRVGMDGGETHKGGFQDEMVGGKVALGGVETDKTPRGRWPANLLLTHHPDCERVGTKRVRAGVWGAKQNTEPGSGGTMGNGWGHVPTVNPGVADPDGKETVEAWECHPDCPILLLDRQSGVLKSGKMKQHIEGGQFNVWGKQYPRDVETIGDKGFASRFFAQLNYGPDEALRFCYQSKASRAERNAGVEDFFWGKDNGGYVRITEDEYNRLPEKERAFGNIHNTVKPLALMRYLITLVTRPEHTVLDPFMGSGSTGRAAVELGRGFIGIDKERDAYEIAKRRIADAQKQMRMAI